MPPLSPVELLAATHDLGAFDCGAHGSLNLWLKRYALVNQSSDSARTYVVHRANTVVGYYALSAGSIARIDATARVAHGLANHPVPVTVLGRLAVDKKEQGSGLGKALLKDALLRIASAANVLGIRAVLVHAVDHSARAFYEKFGFQPSPNDDLHLMLLLKDLRKHLERE